MNKPLESVILTLRNQKVILDADLAVIYGVATKVLNQAVKRNAERFPDDFRFQLTAGETLEVVTNCDHLTQLPEDDGIAREPKIICSLGIRKDV
jgi:hypothetical protein